VPEIVVDESPDVATACSLEEGVRFAGFAVKARFRAEEYSGGVVVGSCQDSFGSG